MKEARSPNPSKYTASSAFLVAAVLACFGWVRFLIVYHRTHDLGGLGLFPGDLPYSDFYVYKPTFAVYHSPLFFQPNAGRSGFAYPPLVALLYDFFYQWRHQITWYFVCTALIWTILLAWAFRRYREIPRTLLGVLAVLCSFALSYPAIFLVERGNLEIFVWLTVAVGLFCYSTDRRTPAAVCFGLAAALKLYPIILLGLFLDGKRWLRPMLIALGTVGLASALAIAFTGPTFTTAATGFFQGVTGFQQHYGATVRAQELRFDHSLFSTCKAFSALTGRSPGTLLRPYYLLCGLGSAVLFFARVIRLGWQNRVLFLTIEMILLPPVSYEYTLVHLYIPLCLVGILLASPGPRPTRSAYLTFAALLLLLMPLDLYPSVGPFEPGQLQALALCVTGALACLPLSSLNTPLPQSA